MSRSRFRPTGNWLRAARSQLSLERLEDRTVPSVAQTQSALELPLVRVDPAEYDASRILVRFRPGAAAAHHLQSGTELEASVSLIPGLQEVRLAPGTTVEDALKAYRQDPMVLYAEPDYRVHLLLSPNDPQFSSMWDMNNTGQTGGSPDADIDAPEAWDVTTGSSSTVVAVIDTGVDYTHPDLAANMWVNPGEIANNNVDDDGNGYVDDVHGYDFVNRDGDPIDDYFHGTHVAGTIGASGDNGIGVSGVNWNVRIMALKFLDAGGSGSTSAAIEALNYAVANGANISNNSWGGGGYSQALFDAIANAGNAGHIFVAAAGNDGSNNDFSPFYPASYNLPNLIAVAATTHTDGLAGFSNYGSTSVDLGAPGENILSTFPTYLTAGMQSYGLPTYYGTISGTSMATPHVAGVVALLWSLRPGWSSDQVISQVLSTVDLIPSLQRTVTGGRLNAAAALGNPPPDTTGPRVTLSTPSGAIVGPVGSIRLTFSESIDVATFTTDDLTSFTGPNGTIDLSQATVAPVPSSNNRKFDVTFPDQPDQGTYSLVLGPQIADLTGNLMNQDNDGSNGEDPQDQYAATFTITTRLIFVSPDVPAPIYDFNVTISYLDITQDVTIGDLEVQLSITHTYVGDLVIYIGSPSGDWVTLSYFNGVGPDFAGTIFDDEASIPIGLGSAPFAGSYQPDTPLSVFDGQNAQGTWLLWIEDWGFFDEGWLTDWSVSIVPSGGGGPPPPPPPPPPPSGNQPPYAYDDYVQTPEDTAVTVAVLANDGDPDGDALAVTGISGVANGTAVINADNTITFTPDANFSGSTWFTYTISDGQGGYASAYVTIYVIPVNEPPIAVDDFATGALDTPLTFNEYYSGSYFLESNDLDPDGDFLRVSAVGNAVHGTVSFNPYYGAITFTPEAGYIGLATFEYTVTDGSDSDVGLVTIDVLGFYYLSTAEPGSLTNSDRSSLTFSDADILQLTVNANGQFTYRIYFDGSDVGLSTSNEDIDAFALLSDGSILVSTVGTFSVPQPGGGNITGDGADLLYFYPSSVGDVTAGSWSIYFDGSDVGLTASAGNIDAVALLNDGRILLSTAGNLTVAGIAAGDTDLLAFTPLNVGPSTSGYWQHYFDGSDVGLTDGGGEDVDAVYARINPDSSVSALFFSTRANFDVPGVQGANEDVVRFTPSQLGGTTAGTYGPGLAFTGGLYGLSAFNVDGFHLGLAPGGAVGGFSIGGSSVGGSSSGGGSTSSLSAAAVDGVFQENVGDSGAADSDLAPSSQDFDRSLSGWDPTLAAALETIAAKRNRLD